jgi:hypothetical protein
MKKYQGGGKADIEAFLKKRRAADTTKMYNRGEMLETINAITAGKIKPRVDKPMASGTGKSKPTTYGVVSGKDTTYMDKADFEKRFGNKKKDGGKIKKAKSGGEFGMLSVKAGIDKNPNPTQADRIAGAKKLAKSGKKVAKKAVKAPKKAMAKKKMMGGGKCKNGC